jgi:peroxiredoxin
MNQVTRTMLFLLLAAVAAGQESKPAPPAKAKVGEPVKDFKLKDVMQEKETFVSLSDYKGKKAVVLAFISYNCDISWRYEGRIGKLLSDFGKKDVAFLAIRSNRKDTADGIKQYAEAKNLAMPVLFDDRNVVADYFETRVTPTFYIVDKKGILRYQGSCDDDMDEESVSKTYVRDALDAVLAGQDVKVASTRAFG